MINRIIRAIKLDRTLFSEVAHNESLLGESLIIVFLVAVVSGIGTMVNASQPLFALTTEVINSVLFGWDCFLWR